MLPATSPHGVVHEVRTIEVLLNGGFERGDDRGDGGKRGGELGGEV